MSDCGNGYNEGFEISPDIKEQLAELKALNESDTSKRSRLNPISAADLPDIEPPEALWAGFIYPGGVVQLNGEPGAGKSTLAYGIASHAAQGKDFLGESFSRKLKILYADLETPEWLRREKIEAICGELPRGLELLTDLDLGRDIDELIGLCRERGYDLIILDTQSKVFVMENENDNAEGNRKAKLLDRLKLETGAAVLLIHHTSKNTEGKSVYRGRGASAIAGSVDIVCNLESLDRDTIKLSVSKSRVPCRFASLTLRKAGNDKFERAESEAGITGINIFQVQDFILDLLSGRVERETPEIIQLAEQEGFSKRTTERSLKRLREAGRVIQVRRGVYALSRDLIDEGGEPEDLPPTANPYSVAVMAVTEKEEKIINNDRDMQTEKLPPTLGGKVAVRGALGGNSQGMQEDETEAPKLEVFSPDETEDIKKELQSVEQNLRAGSDLLREQKSSGRDLSHVETRVAELRHERDRLKELLYSLNDYPEVLNGE